MSKKNMGTTSRYLAASRLLAVCVSIAFTACKDKDHTDICIGPLCPERGPYDHLRGGSGGEGGSGVSGSGGTSGGGGGGETGTGGSSDNLDGGVDASDPPDATVPPPDATVPPPDADVDEPCSVAFLTPTGVDAGQLTLGGGSDVDGEACGDEFTISVSIASNASTVNLFVNDSPLGAQSVLSATTDIDVVLGNRGVTANTLRVLAQMPNGDTCEALFSGDIFVNCDGPSCTIMQPIPSPEDYLNASQDDEPLVADFQTSVIIQSELAHVGETVRLQIDGNYVPDEVLSADGGTGTATFDAVSVDEDLHSVQAECRDALGNVTLSPLTVWNVDITPCTLVVDQIAGGADPVTPGNDLDSNPGNGIQVLLTGTITGTDCVTLNVGECGESLTPIALADLDPGPGFSVPVTLPNATTTFSVCAEVVDDADNTSEQVSRDVDVRTDAPALEITSPDDLTRFNQAGGSGAVADTNPATATCEMSVSVNCTEPNLDVILLIDGNASDTAPCTPQSGLPSPYLGVATFGSVSLNSENGGAFTTLSASQDAPGLPTGTATPISVQADCEVPACSIISPDTSLDFLNALADSSGDAGFQTSFVIASDLNSAGENARVTFDSDSGTTLTTALDVDAEAIFADVTLTEGLHSVEAECFDAAGNIGTTIETWTVDTTPCTTTLIVAGGVTPITPGQDNDGGTAGLQVDATGETSGGDCTTARVGVCGSLPATFTALDSSQNFTLGLTLAAVDGTPSVCVEIEDQAGNVGQDDVTVTTRTSAPELAIATPADLARFNRTGALGATVDLNLGTNDCEADIVVNCTDVGVDVELLINSNVAGTATCQAQTGLPSPFQGQATFSSIVLASDDSGGTDTMSAQQTAPGLPVGTAPPITVQPDCNAPSCAITSPDGNLTFLNAALDSSGSVGFQSTFTVQGDTASAGANVELIFDGNTAGALTIATDGSGLATFTDVTVAEGLHNVEAECSDSAGNVTTSASESWTVDTTACTSTLVVASGVDPITTDHDLNLGLADLQVLATGDASGGDCVSARVGVCLAVSGGFTALDSGVGFSLGLTLPSVDGATSACVEVLDQAGNVGSSPALLNVRVSPPVVVITSPADGATFNATSTCTQDIEVTCTDDGEDVDLYVDAVLTDTEVCTNGTVTFTDVVLPEHDDATTATIAVEQTADGLTSLPESITVQADCNVPEPTFSDPTCPSQLALAGDDVNSGVAGLQYDVNVLNDGGAEVTLTVTRGGIDTDSTNTGDLTSTSFPGADLGGAGSITLTACATDIHDNEGCSTACAITIAAEPTIDITSPTEGAIFTSASTDCDTNTGGLQVTVSGTTTAADGATVQVTLGAANPATGNVSGGTWSACVPTLEGDNQTLTAVVTDVTTLTGSDDITVSVDAAPSGSIAPPTFEVTGRREGTVDLTWLAVLDTDSDPLAAYHVRCASTDITDQTSWDAATIIPNTITPSAVAGTEETLELTGVRTGTTRFCLVRGEDDNANLSPIAPLLSAMVTNPFLQQAYSIVDDPNALGAAARISVDPIGDINGDGIADFIHGATQRVAQVYFGKTTIGTNPTESPDIEITFGGAATNNQGFGSEVAGLGDITGDGIPDFAIGAPNSNAVFVFFGRASDTWPDSIDVDANSGDGCEADLCITGPASGLFGWDIHSANIDNAGANDLVIGARTSNTRGQVFVLLGGAQLATSGTTITLQNTTPETNSVVGFLVNGPATNRPNFGFSVGSIGTNLLISANGAPATGSNAGANYVLPTQATPGPGTGLTVVTTPTLQEIESGTAANFGVAIRAIGDYDNDGFGDFAAGKLFNTGGTVTVYRGSAGNFSSGTVLQFTNDLSASLDDNYGSFIAAGLRPDLGLVGDLDNDGIPELLIGAGIPDTGSAGIANLFYGATGAVARSRATADFSHTSTLPSGQVVPNFVGDINDDGFNDMVMLDSGISTTTPNALFLLY